MSGLLHEVRKLLAGHNDALPQRAKRDVYVTWILPSRHMNYKNDRLRETLANAMTNIVEIHNERNLTLGFKQNWDQYDPSIFFHDSQRYSTEGLNRFWKAFDRTVWYANVLINKAENRKISDQNNQRGGNPPQQPHGGFRGGRGGYFARKKQFNKFSKRTLPPPP